MTRRRYARGRLGSTSCGSPLLALIDESRDVRAVNALAYDLAAELERRSGTARWAISLDADRRVVTVEICSDAEIPAAIALLAQVGRDFGVLE